MITPDPWPWPGDSVLDRARRVATSYRHALETHAPEVCQQLDERSRALGQAWVLPDVLYDDDDLLNSALAADFLHVQPRTVYEYGRLRGLHATHTPDGLRYRVSDLKAFVAARRARRRDG